MFAFAFHFDQGSFGDTSLDEFNAALIARTPGPTIDGNWQVALNVDERAALGKKRNIDRRFGTVSNRYLTAHSTVTLWAAIVPVFRSVSRIKFISSRFSTLSISNLM